MSINEVGLPPKKIKGLDAVTWETSVTSEYAETGIAGIRILTNTDTNTAIQIHTNQFR